MNQIKKKWDRLSEEERKRAIDGLIAWYKAQRDEEIGYLAAEAILDQVLELLSDTIYKKGIHDTKQVVDRYLENLKVDLDMLGYDG